MQKTFKLESQPWSAGGNLTFRLADLPPGYRARGIRLFFDLSGTKGASDALTAPAFARMLRQLRIGEKIRGTGLTLQRLYRVLSGRKKHIGTDIPGSGTSFDMEFVVPVPFMNPAQPGMDDGSMNTTLLRNKTLELDLGAADLWGVGSLAVTAGTVRAEIPLVEGESVVPQVAEIGYSDPGNQDWPIAPGVYQALLIQKKDSIAAITEAELSDVTLDVDNRNYLATQRHDMQVFGFNDEAVADQADRLVKNVADFFPVIYPRANGKGAMTKQPAVETSARAITQGTLVDYRVSWYRGAFKSDETIDAIGQLTGRPPEADDYTPATAKGGPFRPRGKSGKRGDFTKKDRIATQVLPGKYRVSEEEMGG